MDVLKERLCIALCLLPKRRTRYQGHRGDYANASEAQVGDLSSLSPVCILSRIPVKAFYFYIQKGALQGNAVIVIYTASH
jgi:hypothetical protein